VKHLPLLFGNLLRKKTRTVLTLLSFAVALFLFGLLMTIRGGFNQGIDAAGVDRLMVIGRMSLIQPLPIAYRDKLLKVPGITHVTYSSWFGGVYQDEKNFFPQFAIDQETWRDVYPEFLVPADQWRDFLADRQGVIVGRSLAQRFGWKLGDRIPLRGTIFSGGWEFNLRGIYTGRRPNDDLSQFWMRADYLREKAPSWWRDLVGWYVVRIENPDRAVAMAKAIDEGFANSRWETKTQTEKMMAASFVKQMGNIEFLILSIGGVVFFTLLLVTGNTMAIAVRERTSELAVLKAVGFSDGFVLGLVLVESTTVACIGGALGLGLAKLFTAAGDPTNGMLPVFYLPGATIVGGLFLALTVGLLAGLLPAVSAMRLRVIDALRRV
jgi:putative ABC transport system permease protein